MIRIVSPEGRGPSTTVLDAKTGQDITKLLAITDIHVHISGGYQDKNRVELTLYMADVEVEGIPVWKTKHPDGGYREVARVVYSDGTEVEFPSGEAPSVTR